MRDEEAQRLVEEQKPDSASRCEVDVSPEEKFSMVATRVANAVGKKPLEQFPFCGAARTRQSSRMVVHDHEVVGMVAEAWIEVGEQALHHGLNSKLNIFLWIRSTKLGDRQRSVWHLDACGREALDDRCQELKLAPSLHRRSDDLLHEDALTGGIALKFRCCEHSQPFVESAVPGVAGVARPNGDQIVRFRSVE